MNRILIFNFDLLVILVVCPHTIIVFESYDDSALFILLVSS